MAEFLTVLVVAALVDNIVLTKMLGLCPFVGLSRRLDIAAGAGAATTAVLTVACMLAFMVEQLLPASFAVVRALLFIALVACVVSAAEMLLRLAAPLLHRVLGVFLPLIATNCAVLGVMLLALQERPNHLGQVIAMGLGGGGGFALALILLALLRRRTVEARVPPSFQGAPLGVLTAGIMALALSGVADGF